MRQIDGRRTKFYFQIKGRRSGMAQLIANSMIVDSERMNYFHFLAELFSDKRTKRGVEFRYSFSYFSIIRRTEL